jgi:hypothetical protein
VTRFGHKGMIVPRADRAEASVPVAGGGAGKARQTGSQAALRFVIGGRVVYRKSTKGFHPTSDWAADAMPEVKRTAERVMGKLAKKIEIAS